MFIPLTPIVLLPDCIPVWQRKHFPNICINCSLFSCFISKQCIIELWLFWISCKWNNVLFFLIHSILLRFIYLIHVAIVDSFSLLYDISTCKLHHYPDCCWWTCWFCQCFVIMNNYCFEYSCTCSRISLAHYSSNSWVSSKKDHKINLVGTDQY